MELPNLRQLSYNALARMHARGPVELPIGEQLTVDSTGVSISDLDTVIAAKGAVYVDLSRCIRFDIVALLHLVAVTAFRHSAGRETRFRLPVDKHARHYLRQRQFPSAVDTVTYTPFRLLVDEANGHYFGEPPPKPVRATQQDASDAIQEYLTDNRFFGLKPYRVVDEADRGSLIAEQWQHWRAPLVVHLLERRFPTNNALDVARVVVQELLSSLLVEISRGPVVFASQMDTAQHEPRPVPSLTFAAWHNADDRPNIDLLDLFWASIDQPARRDAFEVKVADAAGTRAAHTLLDTLRVALVRYLESRRESADRKVPKESQQIQRTRTPSEAQANAMEALYRFVVDAFGGTIDIWSGTSFAQVSKSPTDPTGYRVTISDSSAKDLGNIIAIRLPLADE